jgi:hypothetical protein
MKALTIQSYIWISYECGLVFVSIYRNRKSATSRSYSMFLAAEEDPLDVDRHRAAGVPHGGRAFRVWKSIEEILPQDR